MRKIAFILFTLGLLLGMLFNAGAIWADLEAFLFDSSTSAEGTLHSFKCPVIIAPHEAAQISARFTNPLDRQLKSLVRFHATEGLVTLFREEDTRLDIQPGGKQSLQWQVTAEDAVWDRIVLARVHLFRDYPLPERTAACGVLVVNLAGLPGAWVTWLTVGLSLAGMLGGVTLWGRANQPLKGRDRYAAQTMAGLLGFVLACMAANLFFGWILAGALFVFGLLLLMAAAAYFIMYS